MITGEEHSLLTQDFSLLWFSEHDVDFVRHERNSAVCRADVSDLVKPVTQIAERVQARDVEDEYHTECTSVVVGCHGLESFTACSVPYLQIDGSTVLKLHHFARELNSW